MKRLTPLLIWLLPTAAFANSSDSQAAAGIIIFILVMLLVLFILALVIGSFVFWLMMLIHAVKNEIPDRDMWLVVLAVSFVAGMPLVGALVYYFVVKRKLQPPKIKPRGAKKPK